MTSRPRERIHLCPGAAVLGGRTAPLFDHRFMSSVAPAASFTAETLPANRNAEAGSPASRVAAIEVAAARARGFTRASAGEEAWLPFSPPTSLPPSPRSESPTLLRRPPTDFGTPTRKPPASRGDGVEAVLITPAAAKPANHSHGNQAEKERDQSSKKSFANSDPALMANVLGF